jgi:hypothetical protein
LGELGSSQKSTVKKIAAGALGATMMLGMMTVFMTSVPADVPVLGDSSDTETIGTPNFDKAGRYVLTDYDQSKPFASFLPSVNGKYGMPMWSFYVNRGQVRGSRGSRPPQPQPQPRTRALSSRFGAAFNRSFRFARPLRCGRAYAARVDRTLRRARARAHVDRLARARTGLQLVVVVLA